MRAGRHKNSLTSDQKVVGVYVGAGASHSWTWVVEIFERIGFYSLSFMGDEAIQGGALSTVDVLIISGGDTFAIAAGLGSAGAQCIKDFVYHGGIYIGSCAGAYLPLYSSIPPLDKFNFVRAKVTNLTRHLYAPKKMAEKFCTPYGCRYIFHPVREEVIVKTKGLSSYSEEEISVPLYGGPAIEPSEDISALATYEHFTDQTEFLVDREIAQRTLLKKIAAAYKPMGRGSFYLFGPHFEHPHYGKANQVLFQAVFGKRIEIKNDSAKASKALKRSRKVSVQYVKKLKSAISNARIAALSLERTTQGWIIGKKYYEPEKISIFLDTIWKRIANIDNHTIQYWNQSLTEQIVKLTRMLTEDIKNLKKGSMSGEDTTALAEHVFLMLKRITADFLTVYFYGKRKCKMKENEEDGCTFTLKPLQHSM